MIFQTTVLTEGQEGRFLDFDDVSSDRITSYLSILAPGRDFRGLTLH
jgi:hypothetical protein